METAPSPQALSNGTGRPFDSGLIRDKMQVGVDFAQSNSSCNKIPACLQQVFLDGGRQGTDVNQHDGDDYSHLTVESHFRISCMKKKRIFNPVIVYPAKPDQSQGPQPNPTLPKVQALSPLMWLFKSQRALSVKVAHSLLMNSKCIFGLTTQPTHMHTHTRERTYTHTHTTWPPSWVHQQFSTTPSATCSNIGMS